MSLSASISLKGVDEMKAKLAALVALAPDAGGAALYQEGEGLKTDSQEHYVPVDQGVLKNSAFVNEPQTDASGVFVTVGYGGAAKDYAVIQHENTTFTHTVGSAKYLELPLLARASGMTERMLGTIRSMLGIK